MMVANAHSGVTYDGDNLAQAYSLFCIPTLHTASRMPNSNIHPLLLHHWEDDMTFQSGDLLHFLCYASSLVPLLHSCDVVNNFSIN